MGSMSMQNLIKIEICSMAKVVVRKTMYKTYGIFPIRKKKKLEVMSVCITEHKAFPTSGANVSIDCI
jgi:hypothetical protein